MARLILAGALFAYFGNYNPAERAFWYTVASVAVYYFAKHAYIKFAEGTDEKSRLAVINERNKVELSHEKARLELKMQNFRQMAEMAAQMREKEMDVTKQIWELRKQIADAEREENAEFARQMQAILADAGLE